MFSTALLLLSAHAFGGVPAINGGGPVGPGDPVARQTIALQSGSGSCSGTLIDRRWVLSTAHCVVDERGAQSASAELLFDDEDGRRTVPSRRIVVHEGYLRDQRSADIALLELTREAPSPYQPALLARAAPRPGLRVIAAGFGQRNGESADGLYKTSLTLQESVEEDSISWQQSQENGICYGDSGGSIYAGDSRTLLGVISHGDENCEGRIFATSVAHYLPWIQAVLGGKSPGRPEQPDEPELPRDPEEDDEGPGEEEQLSP